MSNRKQYILRRLMELADIAENRPLEDIEKREEKRLEAELATLSENNN